MSTPRPQPFVEGIAFGEGPRWHDGALWFSDIAAGEVRRVGDDGSTTLVATVPGRPSGLGWLPDGRLLVVSMRDRALLRLDPGGLVVHADLAHHVHADTNDMVVDPDGNAYITNLGYDADTESPRTTGVILVRPDGTSTAQPDELLRPNGCVITPDRSTFVVAETRVGRLTRYTITDDGSLTDGRPFARLGAGAWADGICLDAEGAIWASDPPGSRFVRVLPGGEVTDVIDVAPLGGFACMLGGPDRRTLFLCVADLVDLDENARRRTARIDAVVVDVPGAGWP